MISRRRFLTSTAAAASGLILPASYAQERRPYLRTITYNILACKGFPNDRNTRTVLDRASQQIPRRLAFELELYAPDIVTFQESPPLSVVRSIAEYLGMKFVYFPGGFPGTLMTAWDIAESENKPSADGDLPEDLFTRHWGRAVLAKGRDRIHVFSAHLHPREEAIRLREQDAILEVLRPHLDADDSVIFQGDLNHMPSGPEYRIWREAGLVDAYAAEGRGQPNTIISTGPGRRIDYVWLHGPIADRLDNCRVLFEGAFRTNPEDARSFALSDHLPVMATFE